MVDREAENLDFLQEELELKLKKATEPYQGMTVALSGGLDSSLLAALVKPRVAVSVELPYGDKYNEIEYSEKVAKHLGIKHRIVKLDIKRFEEDVRESVKAIGRPIPHFNIFPFTQLCRYVKFMGEDEFLLGDGCDETMCGYTRDLIIGYLYQSYKIPAYRNYRPMLNNILPPPEVALARVTGKSEKEIKALPSFFDPQKTPSEADVKLMRPDMDDMCNSIAGNFGITLHRPFQDDTELDKYMMDLPYNAKVKDFEYGKYLLRRIAAKYLPPYIVWRKSKVGGAVFNVNLYMGWDKTEGEFGKGKWMEYQEEILNE